GGEAAPAHRRLLVGVVGRGAAPPLRRGARPGRRRLRAPLPGGALALAQRAGGARRQGRRARPRLPLSALAPQRNQAVRRVLLCMLAGCSEDPTAVMLQLVGPGRGGEV